MLFLFVPSTASSFAPLHDAKKRAELARVYAPEIRQDRKEKYGFSSVAWFLQRSLLMVQLRSCGRLFPSLRRKKSWPLHPGSSLLYARFFSVHHSRGCQFRVDPFSIRPKKHEGSLYRPAPNLLYLQLRNHHPETLLTGKYKQHVTPEWSYRVYQAMGQRCAQKGWFRRCKRTEHRRFYVVQYIVPLMLNEACNVHEGEMEGMTVLVDRTLYDRAKTPAERRASVSLVAFSGHYEHKLVPANKVTFVHGTHPVAWMGRGGHALYPTPGRTARLKSYPVELRRLMKRTCRKRKRLWGLIEHHNGGGEVAQGWVPLSKKPQPKPLRSECRWVPWLGSSVCAKRRSQRMRGRPLFPFQSPTSKPSSRPARARVSWRQRVLRQKGSTLRLSARQLLENLGRELGPRERSTLKRRRALQRACVLRRGRRGVRLCDVQPNKHDSPCCLDQAIGQYSRWVAFAGRWGRQEAFANSLAGKTAGKLGSFFKRWPLGQSMGNSGPFGPQYIFYSTWRWYNPFQVPKPTPPYWR